jgi:hypothetical protein
VGKLVVELALVVESLVAPGDVMVEARFHNTSLQEEVLVNGWRIRNPSLVLEVRDADDREVYLPPPSPPKPEYDRPDERIAPDAVLVVRYAGIFDSRQALGPYKVRYRSLDPLAGADADPAAAPALESDWISLAITQRRPALPRPRLTPPPQSPAPGLPTPPTHSEERWPLAPWRRVVCSVERVLGIDCDQVLQAEVDEYRLQTISDATPGYEGWNGTYDWQARLNAGNTESPCLVKAEVRIRVNGSIAQADLVAWEKAIEGKWSKKFKVCDQGCCCRDGFAIEADVQWVGSGEHHVVTAGGGTANMRNWGRSDRDEVAHEFGHMLGNYDEYFTVNGMMWGDPGQIDGSCMNNPSNDPVARNYDLVRDTVAALRGSSCIVVGVGDTC